MDTLCFIDSSLVGHLGRFHILAILNEAAMSIRVQIFLWACFLFSWVDPLRFLSLFVFS